jgi:hypothetical protein
MNADFIAESWPGRGKAPRGCAGRADSSGHLPVVRRWLLGGAIAGILVGPASAALIEPALYRSTIQLAPSAPQLGTLPAFPARWWFDAATATELPRRLREASFPPDLAAELLRRLQSTAGGTDRSIAADRALLARFTPAARATWEELLWQHPANATYRWPLSLGPAEWAAIGAEPRWAEAAARIRATGRIVGDRWVFGDLFALEDAFTSPEDRGDFYRAALAGDALLLSLARTADPALDVRGQAAWWQVNGRYRAIEPMLNATLSLPNGPRLDVAHLLPRLPRALLNSFPPDLARADDAGIESSVLASDFFSLVPGADPRSEGTFRAWLAAEAVPAEGPPQYGDLLVYGDLNSRDWPYTVTYIAGQTGFSRRPTAFGPWQFLDLADVGKLNPRFAGKRPVVFRAKAALTGPGEPAFIPSPMPGAWRHRLQLRSVQAGPWGRLRYYDVLLAPASDILEQLPIPDSHPRWVFAGITREQLQAVATTTVPPGDVRTALHALIAQAKTDAGGLLMLEPSLDLVLAVPPEFRTAAFPHLQGGLSVDDYVQHIPFPRGFTVDEWFDAGSLPESVRRAMLRLVYPAGDRMMLSDLGAVYTLLPTRREQLSAHRAALRVPALVVLLERPAPEEVGAIARYWTYGRDKSVAQLIASFAADPSRRFLDIVHLLSPVERELLNTYFTPTAPAPTPSCFWTAFNFGAEQPDERFLVLPGIWTEHRELAARELAEKYEPLPAPSRLGDIIAYRPRGEMTIDHVCVLLADDLVFTKNGFTFSSPWCISRLADLDEQYLAKPGMERVYFRRRAHPAP